MTSKAQLGRSLDDALWLADYWRNQASQWSDHFDAARQEILKLQQQLATVRAMVVNQIVDELPTS